MKLNVKFIIDLNWRENNVIDAIGDLMRKEKYVKLPIKIYYEINFDDKK